MPNQQTTSTTFSLLIEITQLLLRVTSATHSIDLNDLTVNTAGSILGFVMLNMFSKSSIRQHLMAIWELAREVSFKAMQ
ncbi:VanZ family protein [Paenibacillus sp. BIC5C1]|uniref:VanZ family protein n=1 Tax=Paenibacillus TaxID=44249 RepID=UPI0037C53BCA